MECVAACRIDGSSQCVVVACTAAIDTTPAMFIADGMGKVRAIAPLASIAHASSAMPNTTRKLRERGRNQ